MRSHFIKTCPSPLPSQTRSLRGLGNGFSLDRSKFTTTPVSSGFSKPHFSLLLWVFTAISLLYGTAIQPVMAALTMPVFSVLYNFGSDGFNGEPTAGVTVGSDGSLYGTTKFGGTNDSGTVWKINPAGAFSVLYNFDGFSARNPLAGVTLGGNNSLYGTTTGGGTGDLGTVWKINSTGTFSVLHNFEGSNGSYGEAGVTLGSDGSFYGTTNSGGLGLETDTGGTLWKINPLGVFSVLHNFDSDGNHPSGDLTLGNDGNLYGTTTFGGTFGRGVVYRLTLPSSAIRGDVNGDGKIDRADFRLVKASFGKKMGELGFNAKADINNDQVVNSRDLVFVLHKLPNAFCANKPVNLP